MKRILYTSVFTTFLIVIMATSTQAAPVDAVEGKITVLRVHDVGTGYGPAEDFLNVEVIAKLDTKPDYAYGFQLRQDSYLPARQAMFQLLLEAFRQDWRVHLDYYTEDDKKNLRVLRVWVTK